VAAAVVAVILTILKLTRRIPPRVEQIECLGCHQVEAHAPRAQREEKDPWPVARSEPLQSDATRLRRGKGAMR